MTPPEAFAALALVAVACDGVLDRDEAQALRQQLEWRSPYRSLGEARMGEMFDRLLEQLQREGWQGLLAAAMPRLSPAQRESGLAMAAQLVHGNRVVDGAEQHMLERMAAEMDLPPERSRLILEVIALLNRDSLTS